MPTRSSREIDGFLGHPRSTPRFGDPQARFLMAGPTGEVKAQTRTEGQ